MMNKKDKINSRKRASAVPVILIVIMAVILGAAFFIYRDEIVAFAGGKTTDIDADANTDIKNAGDDNTETSGELDANLKNTDGENAGITATETTAEEIPSVVVTIPEPVETTEAAITESDPQLPEPTTTAESAAQPETTAELVVQQPQLTAQKPVYAPNTVIAGEYAPYMLENAIEIVAGEDGGANMLVESPPLNRDLTLHSKIVPININIPNAAEYFKDVIFLGDSVTTGFDLFRDYIKFNGEKVMSNTTVVAVKSYGIFNATRELSEKSVHPLLNGSQALPEDIIAEKEGSKVFICLGLNDVSWQTPETFLNNYATLINRIRAKSPAKTVYIMSITPLTFGGQKESLTNERIMQFNNLLIEFAAYNNIPFLDYAAMLRDVDNNLYTELSSDNYCHIVLEAYNRLTEYLIYHTIE